MKAGSKSKTKEIAMLRDLTALDGYFAEFFKKDLNKMVENILNDFPIEYETDFYEAAANEAQNSKALCNQHRDKLYSMCETMLCVGAETGNERLYERVNQEIGLNELIKLKRVMGLDLTCKEIDYMVSQLN